MVKRKLTVLDVKQALWDERFQKLYPELKEEIDVFFRKPGCACNQKLYDQIFDFPDRLERYFPDRVVEKRAPLKSLPANHWRVINCKADELESKLKKLGPGRKQIAVARHLDDVTVIINEVVY